MIHLRVVGDGESEAFGALNNARVHLLVFLAIVLVVGPSRADISVISRVLLCLGLRLMFGAVRGRIDERTGRELVNGC